jgi:hypothetical protein
MKLISKRFLVKAGNHKPTIIPIKLWWGNKEFHFESTIIEGWYKPEELNDVDGVSKIRGVTFGIHAEKPFGKIPIIKNLVNSFTIGCKPNIKEGVWDIYYRIDQRGVESQFKVMTVKNYMTFKTKIKVTKGFIEVTSGTTYFTTPMVIKMNTPRFGYLLNTYFGGKSVAPKDFITNTNVLIR